MKPAAPEKQVELQSLQDTGYHVDAKWADAVYDKEEVEDPKAALVVSMAAEPTVRALEQSPTGCDVPMPVCGRRLRLSQ